MKKRVIAVLFAITVAVAPVFAEMEFGGGVCVNTDEEGFANLLPTFHAGITKLWIFNLSADSYILPAEIVETLLPVNVIGHPGMMNTIDAGLSLHLWDLSLIAQVGINSLTVYRQSELLSNFGLSKDDMGLGWGSNVRVGAGFRGKNLGFLLSVTCFQQASLKDTIDLLGNLVSSDAVLRSDAFTTLQASTLPSLIGVLYL